ncbi:MAG: hypothetical protein ABGX28_02645 [Methylococcales bacterium]
MKKTQLAAAIAIAVSGAVIAPQASAGDHKGMQSQINALSSMMKQMQKELKRVKSAGGSQSLQEWENTVNAVKSLQERNSRVRFTGGFNLVNEGRGGFKAVAGAGLISGGNGAVGDPLAGRCSNAESGVTSSCTVSEMGWDFGFGFDHHVSDDVMGLLPGVDFLAELMINYSEFSDGSEVVSPVFGLTNHVVVNEISISASPKLKISDVLVSGLSPWIIPAGVEINVISPPSGAVTVTSIGGVAGAGIEYELLDNVYLGLEGRYHWTPGDIGGVDTDGVTAGGSVAFGF